MKINDPRKLLSLNFSKRDRFRPLATLILPLHRFKLNRLTLRKNQTTPNSSKTNTNLRLTSTMKSMTRRTTTMRSQWTIECIKSPIGKTLKPFIQRRLRAKFLLTRDSSLMLCSPTCPLRAIIEKASTCQLLGSERI